MKNLMFSFNPGIQVSALTLLAEKKRERDNFMLPEVSLTYSIGSNNKKIYRIFFQILKNVHENYDIISCFRLKTQAKKKNENLRVIFFFFLSLIWKKISL